MTDVAFDPDLAREVHLKHQRVSPDSCATCGRLPIGTSAAGHFVAEYEKAKAAKDNPPRWTTKVASGYVAGQSVLYDREGNGGFVARTDMANQTEAQALMERIADLLNADEEPKTAKAPLTEEDIREILNGALPVLRSATSADVVIAARRIHERLSQ